MKVTSLFASLFLGLSSLFSAGAPAITTDGSTSMERAIGFLSETWTGQNPVTYNPTGSSSGIQAVKEGRCDIGLSSRPLKEGELEGGLETIPLCQDGITIVLNPENEVDSLDREELVALFSGQEKTWDSGNPVVIIGREAASGTRSAFEAALGLRDQCDYRQELTSNGDVLAAVSQNPNAIGYVSSSSVNDMVKVPEAPSFASTFYLVVKNPDERVQAFLDFCFSQKGRAAIESAGCIPLS